MNSLFRTSHCIDQHKQSIATRLQFIVVGWCDALCFAPTLQRTHFYILIFVFFLFSASSSSSSSSFALPSPSIGVVYLYILCNKSTRAFEFSHFQLHSANADGWTDGFLIYVLIAHRHTPCSHRLCHEMGMKFIKRHKLAS